MLGIIMLLWDGARRKLWGETRPGRHVWRKLGLLEKLMDRDNTDGVMMMTRVMFMESKQPISEDHVKFAVNHIIRKYPILRMTVTGKQEALCWCENDNFTPDITFVDDENWTSVFERNSNATFDSSKGPLWRMIFISNVKSPYTDDKNFGYQYAVLFGCHHSLFDGTSNILVLNDFQDILNALLLGNASPLPEAVPGNLMASPLDHYFTLEFSIWEKMTMLLLSMPVIRQSLRWYRTYRLKKVFSPENLYMKHIGNFMLHPQSCTSIKQIILKKEEARDVFVMCKKQKITVQSALQAASSMALSQLMRHPTLSHMVGAVPNLLSVHINCMIGMKSLLPEIPKDSIGYYALCLPCKLDVSEFSDFWDLARQTQSQLHQDQKARSLENWKDVFFHERYRVNTNAILQEVAPCGRYPELLMAYSNLGKCSLLNRDDSYQVRYNGQVAACSEHKIGAIFSHSVATILDQLHWSVGYYKNVSSEEVLEFYVKEVKKILLSAMEDKQSM